VTVDARAAYQTRVATGGHVGLAHSGEKGIGGTAGTRPHALREAALATCLAIRAHIAIAQVGIAEPTVGVRVWRDRSEATTVVN
jgi:uncharacterized OsmC-like protein